MYERAEERAKELHTTHDLLDEWKRRGDELLYSMIPESIAKSLRRGKEPIDTCEVKRLFPCSLDLKILLRNFGDVHILFRRLNALQSLSSK